MSFSSLTDRGRTVITKLIFEYLDFYLGFGEIPSDYVDSWDIDSDVPSYIAKLIENESITRNPNSLIDYPINKDIREIIQISSNAVSASGILNGYINITAAPGIQGNIQIIITSGGFAGSEAISFNAGVLSVIIQNNATTRQQLANALKSSPLVQNAIVLSNPTTPITIGVGTDNTYLVGGKDQTIYIENIDYTIGYLNNNSNLLFGSINWVGSRPQGGQTYYISYWYKSLLSVQTSLIQAFGFKKAVSKNYVIEDPNGSIKANDTFWSISSTPTKHLALLFLVDNQDISDGKVVRQFGLVCNLSINAGGNENDFLTPDQIVNMGDLIIIDNISPYRHEIINSEQISIVISI